MSLATSSAIEHISEVVARVTRILSGKQIEVVQQGMKVGVEYDREGTPTKVFLPSLSDNPPPELITAIQGFLDKEVAGLLYTDFKDRAKYRGREEFRGGMAKSLQDIIEDTRTENAMKKEFRGSAANFNQVHDFAVREIIAPKHSTETNPTKRQANLALPAIRAAAGDLAYEEFMEDKWEELGNLGGAILHYAQDIRECTSTEESFNVTRKIIRKLEEMNEDDSKGEGDDDGDGDEGDDGEGDGSEGSTGGADDYDPDKDENGSELGAPPDGGGGGRGGSPPTTFKDLDEAFDDSNFDKEMEKKIEKMAKADMATGKYIPFSRQYDYVGPLPNIENALKHYDESRSAKRIMEEAQKNSHVIQQQIQKLFMAKALTRWEPGLKKGKINPASLHKLRFGDPRVFRRKIESDSRDIAVSLVVDMSGSMSCAGKIDAACISALMFSQVLTNLNIPHEISSFSTYHGWRGGNLPKTADVNKMMEEYGALRYGRGTGESYARIAPITNFILKGFGERLQEETKRSVAMIPSAYGNMMANNVDGECVELAGRRLLARKEKRKVMVVMSDGCPAADGDGRMLTGHLKSVVKELGASGVEMLGLGMMDQSVKQYYPKHEVVHEVDQIPTKILELTKHMVVGA